MAGCCVCFRLFWVPEGAGLLRPHPQPLHFVPLALVFIGVSLCAAAGADTLTRLSGCASFSGGASGPVQTAVGYLLVGPHVVETKQQALPAVIAVVPTLLAFVQCDHGLACVPPCRNVEDACRACWQRALSICFCLRWLLCLLLLVGPGSCRHLVGVWSVRHCSGVVLVASIVASIGEKALLLVVCTALVETARRACCGVVCPSHGDGLLPACA
jgi:hypothetical protein